MENRSIKLPTGYLIVDSYERGQLETLSIGDYGKSKNIKADFLGYTREIDGVANGNIMPLQEKWVATLSTQYGCSGMKCSFCLVEDTKIQTPDGDKSIQDLKNGDFVIGQDNDGQNVIQTIEKTYVNDYEGELIEIELESGKTIKITPNHEIKTANGWKTAEKLTEEDELIGF